jgi:hypothetical protein
MIHSEGSKTQPNFQRPQGSRDRAELLRAFPAVPIARASSVIAPLSVTKLLPGPRYIAFYLLALPVFVMALASTGVEQLVSALIAVTWLALTPIALYTRRVALLLPIASAVFLGVGVLTLSFDSAAFVVDVTTTVVMFLVSFPHQWPKNVGASLQKGMENPVEVSVESSASRA